MPKKSTSPAEYVFAKKDGAADWGWSNPATVLRKSWHLAEDARISRAFRAIACGLVAMIAKDIVGHGQFGAWLKNESTFVFENQPKLPASFVRTIQNYMAAARACLVAQDIKPGQLMKSHFGRWSQDHFAGDIKKDPVYAAIVAYIGERSLWEIYVDEGIAREREAHQTHTPASQTPGEAVQLELAGIVESLTSARTNLRTLLSTGNWEKVPKADRFEFITDAIPALKNFALHTTWTAAERAAIESALVGITTELRQGGK